jgi:hypothetical protein
MEQARALSSCFNHVIIPWGNLTVPASDNDTDKNSGDIGKIYQETGYGLTGIAGESRSGDANGQYIRVEAGGGVNTLSSIATGSQQVLTQNLPGHPQPFVSVLDSPILGAEPAFGSAAKTPFRPTAPCENQAIPDLRAGPAAPVPGQTPLPRNGSSPANDQVADLSAKYARIFMDGMRSQQLVNTGNYRSAQKLSTEVAKALTSYDRNDMADYKDAVRNLTGTGG